MDWQQLAQNAVDAVFSQFPFKPGVGPSPALVAHRGAWDGGCTENTLEAFRQAQALKCWAIELDVHFSRDHIPLVHHDANLLRIYRSPLIISETDADQITQQYPGVCRLDQVLNLSGMHFMIEIKERLTTEQQAALAKTLTGLTAKQDFHLLTLEPENVFVSSAFPAQSWILVGDTNAEALVRASLRNGLGGVATHYLFMTKKRVERLHDHGQMAGCGFVPNPRLLAWMWQRKMDWAFTNTPHAFRTF